MWKIECLAQFFSASSDFWSTPGVIGVEEVVVLVVVVWKVEMHYDPEQ